jgi:dGTPase
VRCPIRKRPAAGKSPVFIDHRYRAEVAVLKELTWFYVIKRPSLETLHYGQRRIVRRLHRIYVNAARSGDVTIFPAAQRDQLHETPEDMRIVTDFVAGLTEEMAYELHHRLTGESKGSILDAAASSFA